MNLRPADLERFHRFRITDEHIELHGIRRVTDAEARELGISFKGDLAGVAIPTWGADDTVKGYRVRRDHPEVENGKAKHKYIQSVDPPHLFFERTSRRWLSDTSIDVVFVEAPTSALAVAAWCQRTNVGLLVVATHGCWGWRGRRGKSVNEHGARVDEMGPLPDLDLIPLQKRTAVIFSDANFNSNSKVQAACRAFARELKSRG
jgi:hypothetical protein